jgi:hypothetical protein
MTQCHASNFTLYLPPKLLCNLMCTCIAFRYNNYPASFSFLLCALCVLSWLTTPADARVFLRWGTRSQSTRALLQAGGTSCYASSVSINGTPGEVAVLQFPTPLEETLPALQRLFGEGDFAYQGNSLASAVLLDGRDALRLFALSLGDSGRTLVITVHQSRADFDSMAAHAAGQQIDQLPTYPNSLPRFHAVNHDTGLQFATVDSNDGPVAVNAFYRDTLRGEGWHPVVSAPTNESSLPIYLKENELCCIFVTPADPKTGRHTISMLHKQTGRTKELGYER